MAKVLLDNIETGMELKSDVVDRQGRVLLKAGVELSEKHLRVFSTWGVLEIEIVGGADAEEVKKVYSPELVVEAKQYLDKLFQHNDLTHPVIQKLTDYCQIQYMDSKTN